MPAPYKPTPEPGTALIRYHDALARMAASPEPIVKRLHDAVLNDLMCVLPQVLPAWIAEKHDRLMKQCTEPGRPFDIDKGSTAATFADMDEATAVEMAKLVCEIESDLYDAVEQEQRDEMQPLQDRK
jgi:hypothetical protein